MNAYKLKDVRERVEDLSHLPQSVKNKINWNGTTLDYLVRDIS